MKTKSYEDLIVWQKAVLLAKETYRITEKLPRSEQYGLAGQMRRAAVSIPSNIAEGYGRGTAKDYKQFLRIARGSLYELKTQLVILTGLPFGENEYNTLDSLATEISKMLHVMINRR